MQTVLCFDADLVITDWSSIAYNYAYTTGRPVLFINAPMKIMNPEYQKIDTIPINILVREEIGCSLNLDELERTSECVKMLLDNSGKYYEKIGQFVKEYVYNLGANVEVGAKYIISRIQKKIEEKRNHEKDNNYEKKNLKSIGYLLFMHMWDAFVWVKLTGVY